MHFSESTLSAYPLLTVSKPQKEYFLNVPLKGLHTASGRFLDIIHTCHGPLQKKPLNIYLTFGKKWQFSKIIIITEPLNKLNQETKCVCKHWMKKSWGQFPGSMYCFLGPFSKHNAFVGGDKAFLNSVRGILHANKKNRISFPLPRGSYLMFDRLSCPN